MTTIHLSRVASEIRGEIVERCARAKTPHIGSQLSCVDILVAAYWNVLRIDPGNPTAANRDRFILSKGHAAPALYITLARRNFFDAHLLDSYAEDGAKLGEQPSPGCAPGVEYATGSLGHGLPAAVGMALAGKILGRNYRVFALMSDGECNEGSVWEAAMFAPAKRLGNLCAIVDFNKWQATGRSCEVMSLSPLADKFHAFGWRTAEVDGHDIEQITNALSRVDDASDVPLAVIANTVKGKGVSFMEDDNNWHYLVPKPEQVVQAKQELGLIP
jgi:transketolase